MSTRVAVVGAGIVGLAAASALRRAGVAVRCFEQATPGHAESAGLTRIFRHAHGDPALVRLAMQARAGWEAWEHRYDRRLVGEEGLLITGLPLVPRWEQALREAGAAYRYLEPTESRRALPISRLPAGPVLWDPAGGAIRARRTITLLHADLADAIVPAVVRDLTSTRTGMRVQASAGSWTCDAVLVAAGIDTPRLAAQVGVRLPTILARHARFTFAVRGPQPERLACWIDASGAYGAGLSSYGQPVGTSGRYAVGVSEQEADYPATMTAEEVSRRAREVARRYVPAALPGLDPQPEAELHCTSNRTGFADGDGFGAVQGGAVTVVYGNNLFKFAPLLGDLLAHAVVHQELPIALRTWTLARG
jgi:sarcosine oxidase